LRLGVHFLHSTSLVPRAISSVKTHPENETAAKSRSFRLYFSQHPPASARNNL
jgi:hypothetical protein